MSPQQFLNSSKTLSRLEVLRRHFLGIMKKNSTYLVSIWDTFVDGLLPFYFPESVYPLLFWMKMTMNQCFKHYLTKLRSGKIWQLAQYYFKVSIFLSVKQMSRGKNTIFIRLFPWKVYFFVKSNPKLIYFSLLFFKNWKLLTRIW